MKINQTQDMLGVEKIMSKKQGKRYTLEFKCESLNLWEDSGKSAAEIERELGRLDPLRRNPPFPFPTSFLPHKNLTPQPAPPTAQQPFLRTAHPAQ